MFAQGASISHCLRIEPSFQIFNYTFFTQQTFAMMDSANITRYIKHCNNHKFAK